MRFARAHLATLRASFALLIFVLFPLSLITQTAAQQGDTSSLVDVVVELQGKLAANPTAYGQQMVQQGKAERVIHVYQYALKGVDLAVTVSQAQALQQQAATNRDIVAVHRTVKIRVDPLFTQSQMPAADFTGNVQVVPTGIQRIGETPPRGNVNVDVAIIDTGIDPKQPDLNVVGGVNCTSDPQADWSDGFGHGTHVAGIIGAKNNTIGVVGVAPGARLWSVRVLGSDGSGSDGDVLCGIDWVAQHAATIHVANMSLGGPGGPSVCGDGTDPLHDGICGAVNLGVSFAVAAGNDSYNDLGTSPANYPEVITVSAYSDFDGQPGGAGIPAEADNCYALSKDDQLAAFSNYGPNVTVAAPGVCILSTLPGDTSSGHYIPQYGYASGTSMATPYVTGAIARYLADNPTQTNPILVKMAITQWSKQHNPGQIDGDPDSEPLLYVGKGIPAFQPPQGCAKPGCEA